jgi:hypothetical protein
MLQAIAAGEHDPQNLTWRAKDCGRNCRNCMALQGHNRDHHRFLLGQLFEELTFIEVKINKLEQRIQALGGQIRCRAYQVYEERGKTDRQELEDCPVLKTRKIALVFAVGQTIGLTKFEPYCDPNRLSGFTPSASERFKPYGKL